MYLFALIGGWTLQTISAVWLSRWITKFYVAKWIMEFYPAGRFYTAPVCIWSSSTRRWVWYVWPGEPEVLECHMMVMKSIIDNSRVCLVFSVWWGPWLGDIKHFCLLFTGSSLSPRKTRQQLIIEFPGSGSIFDICIVPTPHSQKGRIHFAYFIFGSRQLYWYIITTTVTPASSSSPEHNKK